MKNSVSITIPSHIRYYTIAQHAVHELTKSFTQEDVKKVSPKLTPPNFVLRANLRGF